MAPQNRVLAQRSLKFSRRTDSVEQDFDLVRGRDVSNKLVAQHPEIARQLRRAESELSSDPDQAKAMHAVAASLLAQQINLFISYRSARDSAAAMLLADAFRKLSDDRVKVTIQDEFGTRIAGRDFREAIDEAIAEAHWFILLASEQATHTDWCMYETGVFRGTMVSKKINRLVCVHHPDAKLPDPIGEFQAVAATPPQLVQLFDGLLRQPSPLPGWDSIGPLLESGTLETHANRIAEAFSSPSRPVPLSAYVDLTLPRSADPRDPDVLAASLIHTDRVTAELFGKLEPPQTWGELVTTVQLENNTQQWLLELAEVLDKARKNERFRPVSGTFESPSGGRVVRPILESVRQSRSEATFRILFVEEICSAPVHRIPAQTLALLTAVRMNNRIRWEVVERFRTVEWDVDTIDACAKVFSRIEREVDSFGKWNLELLCANFPESAAPEVRDIVLRWRALRAAGTAGDQYMRGELDRAFRDRDVNRVGSLLAECAELNRQFLSPANPVMDTLINHSVSVHGSR